MFENSKEIDHIEFSVLDRFEISKGISRVSVEIYSSTVEFEKNNTLHDIRMGAFKNVHCGTCKQDSVDCNGHPGHIKLYFPVLNPYFIDTTLKKIIETFCIKCYKKLNSTCICGLDASHVKYRSDGMLKDKEEHTSKKRKIEGQKTKRELNGVIKSTFIKIICRNNTGRNSYGLKHYFELHDGGESPKPLSIKELYNCLVSIPKSAYLKYFPNFKRFTDITDSCFIHNLLVLPTCARVPNNVNGSWYPNNITSLYSEIIKKNLQILRKDSIVIPSLLDEYHSDLQSAVNMLFDTTNTKNKVSQKVLENGGIRQRIDGKTGRVRNNLMGKRVDFSARTVLSGDPNLNLNQIGVPRSIANDLTIPIAINKYNIDSFLLGKYKAKYLFKQGNRDQKFDLSILNTYNIEIGDVIERCLIDGDLVAVNRQPTLHRGSIVACYVKVFDCSTFRLNYSTMTTLNADTDGDEINIHVPQDLESKAELEGFMLASINIVSSQNNQPLIGLTQDSLLGCYNMSRELLIEQDLMEILYKANCYKDYEHIKPDILKPRRLYSGIRLIEFVLDYLDIKILYYEQKKAGDFLIIENKVIRGILNKYVVCIADNSIFHQVFLRYGHIKAAEMIHALQLVAYAFLDIYGFSVGISDCIVEYEELNIIELEKYIEQKMVQEGEIPDEEKLMDALNKVTQLEPPEHLIKNNRMLDMILSGAKGNMVKFNQMTRCVGQQFEESGRIKKNFDSGRRTLPHFTKFSNSLESNGFVKNSFLKGLSPQEFFLHSIPSRITLIDTACKTSVTGAQYRRLVKSLENAKVVEDHLQNRRVINTSTDMIIQFNYGEDDMDGTFLKRENI